VKIKLFYTFIIVITLLCSLTTYGDQLQVDSHSIIITGDKITLKAKNAPLLAILDSLSRQGVRIQINSTINPSISASFNDAPIEKVMDTILKGYNYTLIWEKNSRESSNELSLVEAYIFYNTNQAAAHQVGVGNSLNIEKGEDGSLYVKNSLLFRVSPNMSESDINKLVNQLQATVIERNLETGIIRLQLAEGSDILAAVETVAAEKKVLTVEPDYVYPISGNEKIAGGNAETLPFDDNQSLKPASGTPIAVLDSGLAEEFHGSPFIVSTYDALAPDTVIDDQVGHGTQMSLIASGAVKPFGVEENDDENRSVVSIRSFDENGFTSNSILLNSFDHAIETGARVVSMSWGSETKSELLEYATQYAVGNNLILVAAAGNEPSGIPVYPAAFDEVIGVGALTADGKLWENSNYGDFISLYAPGVATLPAGNSGETGTYAGTSIATAYVANEISVILDENPEVDKDDILNKLLTNQSNELN